MQRWKLRFSIYIYKNSTINDSVNFQTFFIKFCTAISNLLGIISCKLCLNRLRFSHFIMKRVGLQFFSDTLYFVVLTPFYPLMQSYLKLWQGIFHVNCCTKFSLKNSPNQPDGENRIPSVHLSRLNTSMWRTDRRTEGFGMVHRNTINAMFFQSQEKNTLLPAA